MGSVVFCFVTDIVLLFLPLATLNVPQASTLGPIAFNAIISITVIGFQISYAIPILMRVTYQRNSFLRTDFNLGRFGVAAGWVAFVWLFGTSCIFFWPTASPVDQVRRTVRLLGLICTVLLR